MVEGKFSVMLWSKPLVRALDLDLDQGEQKGIHMVTILAAQNDMVSQHSLHCTAGHYRTVEASRPRMEKCHIAPIPSMCLAMDD